MVPLCHAEKLFIFRQVWIAASLWSRCRPRLTVGAAFHVMSGADQMVSEPPRFSASL